MNHTPENPQAFELPEAEAPASAIPVETPATAPAAAPRPVTAATSLLDKLLADEPEPAGQAAANAEESAEEETEAEQTNPFAALGLAPELLQAVADMGYTQPTPVQQQAIPLALPQAGSDAFIDLMVCSQTGSGKTAAFLLPMLHTLIGMQAEEAAREKAQWQARVAEALARGEPAPKKPRRKNPTDRRNFKPAVPGALVLCPTRELAQQVANDAIELVRHVRGVRIANIVGGMPYQMQIAKLQNANLVVATPGRLLDLSASGQVRLDAVRFLVLDEADRMLDLGFADALAEVHLQTQQRQQTMMFSATFAPRIQQLAMRVMHDGGARVQRIEIATPQERHANIEQQLYWADTPEHRRALLDHWLRSPEIEQAIVFACTQVECEDLAQDLQQAGFAAVSLHGALSQGLRNRRLKALREGRVKILVATDVAARGLDVPALSHVFNYGLPMKAEDYTHRIGRTGRAGRDGMAITLAEIRDRRRLADIEAYTRQPFVVHTIEGMEPQKYFPPVTAPRPGPGGKGGGKFGGKFAGKGGGKFADRFGGRGAGRFGDKFGGGKFAGKGGRFDERFDARADWNERGPGRGNERGNERFGRPDRFERFDRFERGGEGYERPRFERRDDHRADYRDERPGRNFQGRGERAGFAPRFERGGERFDRSERGERFSPRGERFERRDDFRDGHRGNDFRGDSRSDFRGDAPRGGGFKSGGFKPGVKPGTGAGGLRRWSADRQGSADERPTRKPYIPRG